MNNSQEKSDNHSQPLVFQSPAKGFDGIVESLWRGEQRLWVSFWLLGIAITFFTFALGFFMNKLGTPIEQALFVVQVLTIPSYVFWGVAVWRSAFKSSHWIWAIGARFYAVMACLSALAVAVNLVFNHGIV